MSSVKCRQPWNSGSRSDSWTTSGARGDALSRSVGPTSVQTRQAPLSIGFFLGKNTGVGCHFLFQGIFLNPHLLCWQVDSLPLIKGSCRLYSNIYFSGCIKL